MDPAPAADNLNLGANLEEWTPERIAQELADLLSPQIVAELKTDLASYEARAGIAGRAIARHIEPFLEEHVPSRLQAKLQSIVAANHTINLGQMLTKLVKALKA